MSIFEPLDSKVDSLRVLVLNPSSGNDNIVCKLENRTFASKPVYEALSYTWGSLPATKTIQVNGTVVPVRDNLYNALVGLRGAEPRYLWVDAICINQEDILERNYQVSLMAYIYTRARRVIIWLGLPLPQTLDVYHKIRDYLGPRQLLLAKPETCRALADHPYWRRVWVIQELVLANTIEVYFEESCHMGWDQFQDVVAEISENLSVDKIKMIIEQRDLRHTDECRLEQLLENFQHSLCSEPRDGVYGFLGMAHDNDMDVDYHIGYYDLYSETIKLHQRAPFLNAKLPEGRFSLVQGNDRAVRLIMFSALLQRVLNGTVDNERRMVKENKTAAVYRARGGLIGEIIHIGPKYTEAIGSMKADKLWKKALESNYKGEDLQLVRKVNETYSRTIETWSEDQVRKLRAVETRTSYGYQVSGEQGSILFSDKDASTFSTSEPRRFLATHMVMGIAPPGARAGDLVCGFWGTDIHIILRRMGQRKESWDRWIIVGRAHAVIARSGECRERADFERAINFKQTITDPNLSSETKMKVRDMVMNLRLDLHTLQQLTC